MQEKPVINKIVSRPAKNRVAKRRVRNNRNAKIRKVLNANGGAVIPRSVGIPVMPNEFRRYKDPNTLLPALQAYHKIMRDQYLVGLVHPDIAVQKGIPVKLPSDVPIPTASIGYHVQQQYSTSTLGTFLLSWRPCLLLTDGNINQIVGPGGQASQLTYNNDPTLTGLTSNGFNLFKATGVYPTISIQRYRMVSAILKVSYNGSVLNQSGTMLGCATFDPFAIMAAGAFTNQVDTLVDRYANFSLIQNGLWNQSINITKDSEGLECLYVPTDPDDFTFQRAGTYYGSTITSNVLISPDAEGAHIQYIVAGRNLPASASSIIVDLYYNFEVIADPTSAYVLRGSIDQVYNSGDRQQILDTFSDVVKKKGLISPTKRNDNSFWGDALNKVLKLGMKYLPMALSVI